MDTVVIRWIPNLDQENLHRVIKSHLVWLMSYARWLQKPSRCIPNNFLKASITTDTMKIFSITFCTLVTVYYLQNSERRFQNCALRYNFLHPALCCSSFDLKTVIRLRLHVCSWYVQFCMLLKDSVLVLWINKLQCSLKTSASLVCMNT